MGESRQCFCQIFIDDLAICNQRGTMRVLRKTAVVRDDDDGLAFRHKLVKQRENRCGCFGIEIACRLISDQKRWIIRQGTRHGSTLLLPARYEAWQFVHLIGKPDKFQKMLCPCSPLARRIFPRQIHG